MLKLFSRMLNNPSLAKSVVGRALKFFGGEMTLPLYLPLIIRKDKDLADLDCCVEVSCQMYSCN